jgi:multidrug efflux pump subunit AcrA (membrane-fusion protein)
MALPRTLRLGATVTVHLAGDAGTDTLQVPASSIFDQGKGAGVWVLNQPMSTVSFQPVQVRQLDEELATISGSLRPGQEIVALGVHLLHDGERVRVETKGEVR